MKESRKSRSLRVARCEAETGLELTSGRDPLFRKVPWRIEMETKIRKRFAITKFGPKLFQSRT